MTEETKPQTPEAATPPVAIPLSAPPIPGGSIEPGSLHGRRDIIPAKAREENDAELFAKIRSMNGTQMRIWLRNPENKAKFDAAQARKRS